MLANPYKPNNKIIIKLYTPHPGQLKIHKSRARYRVVCCGRRFGKTYMACNEVIKFAAGHGNTLTAWISPSFRQSKIAYRLIRRALHKIAEHNDSELRIELPNGAVIMFFSAENYDSMRGNGFHFVVMDEAADIKEAAWLEVIRPAISDTRGRVLIIGTPKGRNYFYKLFCRGQDPEYTEWASFTAPSSANPYVPPAEIEAARRELPEDTFAQEYLAVFLEESAGVFKGLDRCIRGLLDPDYQRDKTHFYVAGWDPAKFQDYSVVSIIDCHTKELVHWRRLNQTDYTLQIDMVARIAQEFNAPVYMDVTGVGAPLAELLKAEGRKRGFIVEEYLFTNASKKSLIEGLQLAIQQGDITLKEIEVLINELRIFEYHLTPSRNIIYEAPQGCHDDTVISLALAWYGAKQPRGPVMWSPDEPQVKVRSLERPESPETPRPVADVEQYEPEDDWQESGLWIHSEV